MDFLSAKWVKIRKPHRCWGCAAEFQNGTRLHKVNNIDGGQIHCSYWCEVCAAFWQENMDWDDDGIDFGAFKGEEFYEKFKLTIQNGK